MHILLPNHKKSGTAQHFREKTVKNAVLSQKTNSDSKNAVLSQKTKKTNNLLEPVKPPANQEPQRFGQCSVFAHFAKQDWDSTAFLQENQQKCRTVPILLVPKHEKIGTVQPFCKKTSKRTKRKIKNTSVDAPRLLPLSCKGWIMGVGWGGGGEDIHIYIYVCTNMCASFSLSLYIYIYTPHRSLCVYTCICVCIYTHRTSLWMYDVQHFQFFAYIQLCTHSVYIHTYLHMYIYIYMCLCIYTHTQAHTWTYTYTCTDADTYTYTHIHVHVHTYNLHVCEFLYMCTHTCIYIHVCKYKHISISICICTHTLLYIKMRLIHAHRSETGRKE